MDLLLESVRGALAASGQSVSDFEQSISFNLG